jgi:choline-glycine betaine transporter
MGIGAVQLNTGLNRLNNGVEKSILVQVFLIAIMTILGGISAHAGLHRGVRNLSIAAFLFITGMPMPAMIPFPLPTLCAENLVIKALVTGGRVFD